MKTHDKNQTVPSGENCEKLSHERDVVARLKASKDNSFVKLFTAGVMAGQDWAAREAEAIQLKRLEEGEPDLGWCSEEGEGYSAAELFFFAMNPESRGDRKAAVDFWETVTGKREVPDDDYVPGFNYGAMNVWSQVKDQL